MESLLIYAAYSITWGNDFIAFALHMKSITLRHIQRYLYKPFYQNNCNSTKP